MKSVSTVYSNPQNSETSLNRRFLSSLKLVTLTGSFGSVKSLAELPSVMTHRFMTEEERTAIGITDNLVRISCGIEDAEDITEDIGQALRAAFGE